MATAPPPGVLARLEARRAERQAKAEEGRARRLDDPAGPSPSAAADAWHARAAAATAALAAGQEGAVDAALGLSTEAGALAAGLPPAAAARLGRAADGLRAAVAAARGQRAFAFPDVTAEDSVETAGGAPAPAPVQRAPPPPPPPPAVALTDRTGATLRLGASDLGGIAPGAALTLARLDRCTVVIAPSVAPASLTIADVSRCRIVVEVGGGGGGSAPRTAMVDGASATALWLAAGQVRVHRATGLDLYTRGGGGLSAEGGAPAPVLEECERVRVGPFLAAGEGDGDASPAQPWACARDFDWPRAGPSPHWSVMEAEAWARPPVGLGDDDGEAVAGGAAGPAG